MQLVYEAPTAQDYVSLRLRSGMGEKNLERSRIALNNSLFTVSIYEDEKLIGFGRVVGDGAITFAVSDIMVDREYSEGAMRSGLCWRSTGFSTKTRMRTAISC